MTTWTGLLDEPLDYGTLTRELRRVDLVNKFWAQNADLDVDVDGLPTAQELLDWIKEQRR